MRSKTSTAYFFLAPALITLLVFFFLPVAVSFLMSLTDFDIYSIANFNNARFIWFQNYAHLLKDPLFWKAVFNTFYFVGVAGPLTIIVAFFTALALNSKQLHFKYFFRLALFLPVITTLVAVAIIWRYLYHPKFGLINFLLSQIGVSPIDWLGNPNWAMPALILLATWKNFGYLMIIFLAGLQAIPEYLYDAAKIDGANWWRQQIHITLPQLAPTSIFVGIITAIGYFQLFAEPYVMTQGGPLNSTLSIVLYLYQQGFRWWRMGYSASIAFVLFVMILAITLIQNLMRKRYGK